MTPGDTLTIAGGTNCTTATSGDTLTINATDTNTQLTTEAVQDIVGGMLTGNTETRIAVTYEDGDGTIDFVVTDMTADTQPLTTEAVQDIVGGMLTGNTETRVAVTYQDGDGTIDFVVDDMTGGGSARSVAGDTDNAIMTWVTSDNTFAAEANMTFNGNSLAVTTGSASAIPCTIKAAGSQTADLLLIENSISASLVAVEKDGTIELGGSGTGQIKRENVSGTDIAGKILDLRGGKSTGTGIGGSIKFHTAPAGGGSGAGVNNHAEALVIDGAKVVDFKKAGGSKTVTLQNDAMDEYMSGTATVTVNATEWLEIKVNGNTRYIPVWS